MTKQRLGVALRTVALSGLLAMAGAGAAFADDANINNTGPGSSNVVTSNDTNSLNETNTNNVNVTNSNNQSGTSGAAQVNNNTTAGSAQSGDVNNNANFATSINVGNGSAAGALGGSGGGSGSGSGGGSGSGAGAGSGSASAAPGSGSGSMSSAGVGGGVSTLPQTGCDAICDVSALRNAYQAGTNPVSALQQTKGLSAGLLGLAALLSLVGAGGSAVFATKRAKA